MTTQPNPTHQGNTLSDRPEHTPEPWRVEQVGGEIRIAARRVICGIPNADIEGVDDEDRATFARIVACVNAMAGISDPQRYVDGSKSVAMRLSENSVPSPSTPSGEGDVAELKDAIAAAIIACGAMEDDEGLKPIQRVGFQQLTEWLRESAPAFDALAARVVSQEAENQKLREALRNQGGGGRRVLLTSPTEDFGASASENTTSKGA